MSKNDETITRVEFEAVISRLRDELTEIINTKSGAFSTDVDRTRPPKPKRTGPHGKKLEGMKNDVRCRIDSELFKMLSAECDLNFSGNMSAALDSHSMEVLWKAVVIISEGIRVLRRFKMRTLSKREINQILMKGRMLSSKEVTKILDEFQKNQPDIYSVIYGEALDAVAEENADMANLSLDLCFDIIWIYRNAFGKPPKVSSRKNMVMNSLLLLDAELKAFFNVTEMDESFRMSLEKRFFNRMEESGFQIEVMRYLEDEIRKYASFKPERTTAISLTYLLLFTVVRLMDDLHDTKN